MCPKYLRETEGGRTFEVAALKEWNKLPINIRASQSVKVYKKNYANFLRESYAGLDHFPISKVFYYLIINVRFLIFCFNIIFMGI